MSGRGSSSIFDQIAKDYLSEIAQMDWRARAHRLGGEHRGDELRIPLFGRAHRLTPEGILDPQGNRASHAVSVVLCKYVLLCPDKPAPMQDWVTFKDFRDAAPFAGAFSNNVERSLSSHFSNRLSALDAACSELGGYTPQTGLSYELIRQFTALPRVELRLLFNDEDEEFPAESTLLFPDNGSDYLDMECLAILGWLLADLLIRRGGGSGAALM